MFVCYARTERGRPGAATFCANDPNFHALCISKEITSPPVFCVRAKEGMNSEAVGTAKVVVCAMSLVSPRTEKPVNILNYW